MTSFAMKLDLSALNSEMDAIGAKAIAQMRPVAQAAAQVLYDEVLLRVPVSAKGHYFHGRAFRITGKKYYFDAGSLRAAIYQAYSVDKSGVGRATYHISWNYDKAPYGHMVENGTPKAAAHPFLRPAWYAKLPDAIDAANAKFHAGMAS